MIEIKATFEIDENRLRDEIGKIIRTEVYATSECCGGAYLEYVEDAEREIVKLIKDLLGSLATT